MQDDFDKDLRQLFQEGPLELAEEPFVNELLCRVEKVQARHYRIRWLLTTLVLAVCVVSTPYVIEGTVLLCNGLTQIMNTAGEFLTTELHLSWWS